MTFTLQQLVLQNNAKQYSKTCFTEVCIEISTQATSGMATAQWLLDNSKAQLYTRMNH